MHYLTTLMPQALNDRLQRLAVGLNSSVMLFGSFVRTALPTSQPRIPAVTWRRIHSVILIQPEPEELGATSLAPRHAWPGTPRQRTWQHPPESQREGSGKGGGERRKRSTPAGIFSTIKPSRTVASPPSSTLVGAAQCSSPGWIGPKRFALKYKTPDFRSSFINCQCLKFFTYLLKMDGILLILDSLCFTVISGRSEIKFVKVIELEKNIHSRSMNKSSGK